MAWMCKQRGEQEREERERAERGGAAERTERARRERRSEKIEGKSSVYRSAAELIDACTDVILEACPAPAHSVGVALCVSDMAAISCFVHLCPVTTALTADMARGPPYTPGHHRLVKHQQGAARRHVRVSQIRTHTPGIPLDSHDTTSSTHLASWPEWARPRGADSRLRDELTNETNTGGDTNLFCAFVLCENMPRPATVRQACLLMSIVLPSTAGPTVPCLRMYIGLRAAREYAHTLAAYDANTLIQLQRLCSVRAARMEPKHQLARR